MTSVQLGAQQRALPDSVATSFAETIRRRVQAIDPNGASKSKILFQLKQAGIDLRKLNQLRNTQLIRSIWQDPKTFENVRNILGLGVPAPLQEFFDSLDSTVTPEAAIDRFRKTQFPLESLIPYITSGPRKTYYNRAYLAFGPNIEAAVLVWPRGSRTEVHDHGGSNGLFAVLGSQDLVERKYVASDGSLIPLGAQVMSQGAIGVAGARDFHEIWNTGPAQAISLHVYWSAVDRASVRKIDLIDEAASPVPRSQYSPEEQEVARRRSASALIARLKEQGLVREAELLERKSGNISTQKLTELDLGLVSENHHAVRQVLRHKHPSNVQGASKIYMSVRGPHLMRRTAL